VTEGQLPVGVPIAFDQPAILSYWLDRARQHTTDSYVGIPLSKFPEDLRVYEHLMWLSRTNVVIEIGAQYGGSALWFRDRLETMARYGRISGGRVVSVELDVRQAEKHLAAADPRYAETISLIAGDVRDPDLPPRVRALIPDGARCMVVEDSAHMYDTTLAALNGFAGFVPTGGYFVVEDGCVDIDERRLSEDWPRGVLPALRDWLTTTAGARFMVRRDLERYGLSCHPHGFLQRVEAEVR
jgi:cephalosporin hydroxylase